MLMPVWQSWALVGLITLVVGGLLVELRLKGLLEPLQRAQYDWTTSVLATSEQTKDVLLVAISDDDLGQWGWPVPDAQIAQLTETLLAAGATAVGIDIYRDVPAGDGRDRLINILNDPRVVVISKLADAGGTGIDAPAGVKTGFSDIPIDPDGVVRRALLLVNTPDGIAVSLSMQLAAIFSSSPPLQSDPDNPRFLAFGTTTAEPLAEGQNLFRNADTAGYQIMIDYLNDLPIAHRVPAADVLAGKELAQFDGKTVIIGVTSHSVKDYFSTPLNRATGASFTFGAEVHAAIAQQLIDYSNGSRSPLSSLSDLASSIIILLSTFAGACVAVFVRMTSRAIGLATVGGAVLFVGLSALQAAALLAPAATTLLGWSIGFLIGFAVIAGISRNQRRAIVQVFSSHLSEELSAEIWQQRKRLLSGGKPRSRRLFVTALLADIEGSTRVGNSMDAEDFMVWVSRILDRLGEIAREHGGFVEKFTGDGILVVFGAPIPSETESQRQVDAQSALQCARAMRRAAIALNAELNDQPKYNLRIALNSGETLGGTLGVSGSLHYNVIGDTINVAARLESWTKSLDRDSGGFRPVCMTMATARTIDPNREWPVLSSFLHDDGVTDIQVVAVEME